MEMAMSFRQLVFAFLESNQRPTRSDTIHNCQPAQPSKLQSRRLEMSGFVWLFEKRAWQFPIPRLAEQLVGSGDVFHCLIWETTESSRILLLLARPTRAFAGWLHPRRRRR